MECRNAQITKGAPNHTSEVRKTILNIPHDNVLTKITSKVVVVEAEEEDTK